MIIKKRVSFEKEVDVYVDIDEEVEIEITEADITELMKKEYYESPESDCDIKRGVDAAFRHLRSMPDDVIDKLGPHTRCNAADVLREQAARYDVKEGGE